MRSEAGDGQGREREAPEGAARRCWRAAAFVELPRPGDEFPAVRIDLADGDSVLSDAPDVDAVLSRFFGRDVELARAARDGYTIDQDHPDEENDDPEGHRDEVVERGSARHFSSSAGIALSISIPNPARASTDRGRRRPTTTPSTAEK